MIATLAALHLALAAAPPVKNPDLKQALDLFDQLEYEQALGILDRIADSPDLSAPDRVTANLYDGIVAFNLARTEAAHAALLKALKLDPKVFVPPDSSPKLMDFFAQVKAEAATLPAAKPDLNPKPKPGDENLASSDSGGGSHTGVIIGVSVGATVVVAGAVVAILLLSKGGAAKCTTPAGTGCINVSTATAGIAQW